MEYILIEYPDGQQGYQEVSFGNVQRYTDLNGNTVNTGGSCVVINAAPTPPVWALPDPVAVVSAPTSAVRNITKLQYMSRFTDTELATLYTAAKSVVQIEIWLERFKLAEFIDLDDPTTIAGVHALEAAGLIGAGRALEILNA